MCRFLFEHPNAKNSRNQDEMVFIRFFFFEKPGFFISHIVLKIYIPVLTKTPLKERKNTTQSLQGLPGALRHQRSGQPPDELLSHPKLEGKHIKLAT